MPRQTRLPSLLASYVKMPSSVEYATLLTFGNHPAQMLAAAACPNCHNVVGRIERERIVGQGVRRHNLFLFAGGIL
jgi:hypothetical protein